MGNHSLCPIKYEEQKDEIIDFHNLKNDIAIDKGFKELLRITPEYYFYCFNLYKDNLKTNLYILSINKINYIDLYLAFKKDDNKMNHYKLVKKDSSNIIYTCHIFKDDVFFIILNGKLCTRSAIILICLHYIHLINMNLMVYVYHHLRRKINHFNI